MDLKYIKNNIKTVIGLFILFSSINLSAQSSNDPDQFIPNIIPPSPNAYTLGTYGNTPVGLFTGSQNVSIPLYTYKTSNLEVPIKLSYSSNGIKVDEISSNVGQGWNLSFGGVISRVVRDEPDEIRETSPLQIDISTFAGRASPQALEFYRKVGEDVVDSESDIFNFSFGKYSGKFIYDDNNSIMLMPAQAIKIERVPSEDFYDFIITTPDGVKYYFNDKEITNQRSSGGSHTVPRICYTSWYLTKIVHPKGDEINFGYENQSTTYIASQSQTLKVLYPHIQYDYAGHLKNLLPVPSAIYDNKLTISGKAISSISSNNPFFGKVSFEYSSSSSSDVIAGNKKITSIKILDKSSNEIEKINFQYTTTLKKRVFLDKIQFKDLDYNYSFEYINSQNLPERLSFSQDYWGYFNNKLNPNLVPKYVEEKDLDNIVYSGADKRPDKTYAVTGLLNKIIYPTKGSTKFEYEANSYYGLKEVRNGSDINLTVGGTNDAGTLSNYTKTFVIKEDQTLQIYGTVGFSCEDNPEVVYEPSKVKASYSITNKTTGQKVKFYKYSSGGTYVDNGTSIVISPGMTADYRTQNFDVKANQTYEVQFTVYGQCSTAHANFVYFDGTTDKEYGNIDTGGARISKTSDVPNDVGLPVVKKYYYGKMTTKDISSGIKSQNPYYIDLSIERVLDNMDPQVNPYLIIDETRYLNLSSSSLNSLFDGGGSNVNYKFVTISYGGENFENGGEEHEFYIDRDIPGNTIWGDYDILSTPLVNSGWSNGLEKIVTYYNKNLTPVKKITNVYENHENKQKEVFSYSARKMYDPIIDGPAEYTCTLPDLTKQYSIVDYHAANFWETSSEILVQNHSCYGKNVGDKVGYPSNVGNIMVKQYKNISFWFTLKSTEEIIYDVLGQNPITTSFNYSYNNSDHLQLSSQTTKNSKQETLETKYFYPKDPEMASEPFVTQLISANMIDTPLDTKKLNGTNKISEQKTVYDKSAATSNLLLPRNIYANKGVSNLVVSTDKKITFDQYDDKGNILQYTPDSGTPVCIIWGYNKSQPIAKIENAAYSQISSYVANLQLKSDTGTEADLLTALTAFRNALPITTMVTTYTYKPLIGISTITDPKGDYTTYVYDTYNRLWYIKDRNGKIISENQYHYQTN